MDENDTLDENDLDEHNTADEDGEECEDSILASNFPFWLAGEGNLLNSKSLGRPTFAQEDPEGVETHDGSAESHAEGLNAETLQEEISVLENQLRGVEGEYEVGEGTEAVEVEHACDHDPEKEVAEDAQPGMIRRANPLPSRETIYLDLEDEESGSPNLFVKRIHIVCAAGFCKLFSRRCVLASCSCICRCIPLHCG